MKCFKNVNVYVQDKGVQKRSVFFDAKIQKISRGASKKTELISLPDDAIVLPGFIDQHIHGAGGSDGMDGTLNDISIIANTVAAEGTTSFLVTTMTQSKENILHALQAVKEYRSEERKDGARVVGVHLEGPFIAAAHKGAQPLEYVKEPDVATFDEYFAASGDSIKIVTLAPEIDGATDFIKHIVSKGAAVSIGHTGAKFADMLHRTSYPQQPYCRCWF